MIRLVHAPGKIWYLECQCQKQIKTNNNVLIYFSTNTLRTTKFFARRHVIFWRSFTNVSLLFGHFQHRIKTIWSYNKIVRQRRSRSTSCFHSFITTAWWYDILYWRPCIRLLFCNFNSYNSYNSPIWRGFPPGFVGYKKGALDS